VDECTPLESGTLAERAAALASYGFQCDCSKCVEEGGAESVERGDTAELD
jgi:hypothetical protein